MKTRFKYIKWLSANEMHEDSKEWLSELNFMLNEHDFMLKLVANNAVKLIENKNIKDKTELIDSINRSLKNNDELITKVTDHEHKLEIMVDGINQPKEEELYKDTHRILADEIYSFLKNFKTIKTYLFDKIIDYKKQEKFEKMIDEK